jgi:hypothetical protein
VVASLLKLYLRELPEPLLTFGCYHACMDAAKRVMAFLLFVLLRSRVGTDLTHSVKNIPLQGPGFSINADMHASGLVTAEAEGVALLQAVIASLPSHYAITLRYLWCTCVCVCVCVCVYVCVVCLCAIQLCMA